MSVHQQVLWDENQISVDVEGVRVRLSYLRRPGPRPALLCLHGFGSTKEDYADLAAHPAFDERDLVLLDAPGFGASDCSAPDRVSIPFLRDVATVAADSLGLDRFHLLGHSMGGLTALLLADQRPDRILSLISVEGNLAPEDCFLSRQIVSHPAQDPAAFLSAFVERVRRRPGWSHRLYAASLPLKLRPAVVRSVFESMVVLSDTAPLIDMFARGPFAKLFVYGDENRGLSYLRRLDEKGIERAEISNAGHFPMYANPQELWSRLAAFLDRSDAI